MRRQRRAATPDELRKLIATTVTSGELYGMDGQERSLLYRFCAETGLRANETRSLKVPDFDFERLVVVVPAGYSKHRETDTLPIRKDLAEHTTSISQVRSNDPRARVLFISCSCLTQSPARAP